MKQRRKRLARKARETAGRKARLQAAGFDKYVDFFGGCFNPAYNPEYPGCAEVRHSREFARAIDALESEGVDYRIDTRIERGNFLLHLDACRWNLADGPAATNITGHTWVSSAASQPLGVAQVFDLLIKKAVDEVFIEPLF